MVKRSDKTGDFSCLFCLKLSYCDHTDNIDILRICLGDDVMGERKKKSPFLDKPSGTLPKRDLKDSQLLKMNEKIKENIDKIKKSR